MRVGFIATYPPIECGIATDAQALERALRRASTETFVVSPFGAEGRRVFGIYPAGSDTFSSLVFPTSVNLKPDVVYAQRSVHFPQAESDLETVP